MNREKEESPSIFHSESVESDIGTTEATPVKAWNFGKVMKKIKTKADDIREELKLPPRPKERIKKSASFRSQRAQNDSVERLYKWGEVYEKKKQLMRKHKEEHELDDNTGTPSITKRSRDITKHLLPLSQRQRYVISD